MQRPLDYTATWNDAVALFKAHREIALAIAGVFILLPLIVFGYFAPQEPAGAAQSGDAALQQAMTLLKDALPWLVGLSLVSLFGELAILCTILDKAKPNAEQSMALSAKAFFPVILARLLAGFAILLGFLLLIIPGIYLSIKFSQIGQTIIAEKITSPTAALSRSWELTKGNSIQIFGFLTIIVIVALIGIFIVDLIFALILTLLLPTAIAPFVIMVMSSIFQASLSVLMLFVSAAIYRQLSAAG